MRMTIKLKLGLTFAVIIALSMGTAALGIASLGSLDGSLHAMVRGPVERLQAAEEVLSDLLQVVRGEKNLILAKTHVQIETFEKDIVRGRQEFAADIV
jgi:methyl-accepting chemotaxis protein